MDDAERAARQARMDAAGKKAKEEQLEDLRTLAALLNLKIEREGKIGSTTVIIVKNEKGEYQYSKEGEKLRVKKLTEAAKNLNDKCETEEVEFEPYLVDAETIGETDVEFIELNKNIFIK